LMPLAADQGVGALVGSPLGWGRLTGKIRRGQPWPEGSRLHDTATFGPPVDDEKLYDVVDVLDQLAEETGKTVPQIAINWLLQRPTVSSVIIGARNEAQLRQNLGAVGWSLSPEQIARLDEASRTTPAYPYFPYYRQEGFARINPPIGERFRTPHSGVRRYCGASIFPARFRACILDLHCTNFMPMGASDPPPRGSNPACRSRPVSIT
jgi:hypothetical protein